MRRKKNHEVPIRAKTGYVTVELYDDGRAVFLVDGNLALDNEEAELIIEGAKDQLTRSLGLTFGDEHSEVAYVEGTLDEASKIGRNLPIPAMPSELCDGLHAPGRCPNQVQPNA